MDLFPSPREFRIFAEILENKDNPNYIVTSKDLYEYDVTIKMCWEYFDEELMKQLKKVVWDGLHRYFVSQYPNKRKTASRYISNKHIRMEVFDLHGNKCLNCGSYEDICLDHITAVVNGGENELDNLQPLCRACNSSKGKQTIDYRYNG